MPKHALLWLALALAPPALGETLRDAGYGDGSLVDSQGDYFYPQPDGTYLDTYGRLFIPGENDRIESDTEGPAGYGEARSGRAPARVPGRGDLPKGSSIPGRGEAAGDQASESSDAESGDSGPLPDRSDLYMDVGSGYLELDTPADVPGVSEGQEAPPGLDDSSPDWTSAPAPARPAGSPDSRGTKPGSKRKRYFSYPSSLRPQGQIQTEGSPGSGNAVGAGGKASRP